MTVATDAPEVIHGQVIDAGDPEVATEVVAPGEPTLKDLTASFAKLDAFEKALGDYVKKRRGVLFARLNDAATDTGSKSFNVRDEEADTTLATMTLNDPQPKVTVEDGEKVLDFVMDHFPTEVETVTFVRPAFLTLLTDKMVTHGPEGVFLDPKHKKVPEDLAGTEVPGLKHTAAGPSTSFSTRWKSQDAKRAILRELAAEFAPALGIDPLAITGGEE